MKFLGVKLLAIVGLVGILTISLLAQSNGGTARKNTPFIDGETLTYEGKISKIIRESFPKVKPAIQGDAVRVSGKSRDELQAVIAHLRGLDYPVALQFENYR